MNKFTKIFSLIVFSQILFAGSVFSQVNYSNTIVKGDHLGKKRQFAKAIATYNFAFRTFPDSINAPDLYFAACIYAVSKQPDSAMVVLKLSAEKYKLTYSANLQYDTAWVGFRDRKDWQAIHALVEKNLQESYSPLQREMLSIAHDDQYYRLKADSLQKAEGVNSPKLPGLIKEVIQADSVNLVRTERILDRYGWPSPAEYGNTNLGLFLVIQHSDLKTQLKYLPMFRDAVKTRYFFPPHLAALEDRIAISQGKKQLYGTQLSFDPKTNSTTLSPIEDEPNVNIRRAKLGMEPLEVYLKNWNINYHLPIK